MAAKINANQKISPQVRNAITIIILLLGLFIPLVGFVGLIVMWIWTTWKKWVKIIITLPSVLIVIFLITYLFIGRPFQMTGESMSPTYQNGEYFFTTIYHTNITPIHRGDTIVFIAPPAPTKDFAKRVIGLPGDTIMIQNGSVYINGKKLDESTYLHGDIRTYTGAFLKDGQPLTIPSRFYFVMGDNRPFSSDSREWGLVPQAYIVSKVAFCYWNCN